MSKVVVRLVGKEISNQLLKSEEVKNLLKEKAEEIVARCSGTYEISEHTGAKKSNVSIITKDADTYHRNLKDNELLKALGGQK